MNYIDFCKNYFNVTNIPVSLLKKMKQYILPLEATVPSNRQRGIGKWPR